MSSSGVVASTRSRTGWRCAGSSTRWSSTTTSARVSTLPALPDPRQAARVVYDAVAGFGPLQRHLDDPEVEEIWINEPGRVFVARRGRSELTTTILDDGQVRDLVERMLKSTGRRVDLSTPFAQPSQHAQGGLPGGAPTP